MTEHAFPSVPDDASLPWEEDASETPADPAAPRVRHDAFTEKRKCVFLTALKKTGCVLDACRAAGVSAKTVYRHQESDRRFAEHCRIALAMSATPIELTAWSRAVEGVERDFACGGQVYTRRIYSDGLLRLLLQGSNPRKYGQRPGFTRKQLVKAERKRIEREVRAELAAEQHLSFPAAISELDRYLDALGASEEAQRRADGWTKSAAGHWVPPGYGWVGLPEGWAPPAADPPGESM